MSKNTSTQPNYRAFAKELRLLCKKYGVRIHAYNLGDVTLGPVKYKSTKETFSGFECSPTHVILGDNDPISKNIEMYFDEE